MLNQREVILIGLGNFGSAVLNNLSQIIGERKIQLGRLADSVVLHTINFKNTDLFYATDYMNTILETVKDSYAYKNGEKFSVIFAGDLFEQGTSLYAIDYAYLPHLLEQQDSTFHFSEVLGFFTFASQLGVSQKVPDEAISLICKHFEHLEKINKEDIYKAPFKTINDKAFDPVSSAKGPFDRNYVVITPGKSDVVATETGLIFAERIFYELFYLSKNFDAQSHNWTAVTAEKSNSDKNLSCFSMVQIPRINETQKYYLKYLLEERIVSSFLQEPLKTTDEDYYFKKFLDMIEVPADGSFPLERATHLFLDRYKERFERMLHYYISAKNKDFKQYITDCKNRIEHITEEMRPCYDDFSSKEINALFKTLTEGFKNLFMLDRISGNFKTYSAFIQRLKNIFEQWDEYLKKCEEAETIYDLTADYEKAQTKISKLQKSWIYSLAIFRPIRKKLIENEILSLPVENYLDSLIRQNLAKSLRLYLQGLYESKKHPSLECEKLLCNMREMQAVIENKESYLKSKISFIENMNGSYYILPMFDTNEDYARLLERIKNRNFGTQNEQRIKETISNALKLWCSEKDIYGITQNPNDFLSFLENDFIKENKTIFSETEERLEEFYDFSKRAVEETIHKTETINENSFQTVGTSLFEPAVMLMPDLKTEDYLSEVINARFERFERITIPKDFSLGSVLYFKDYLFMSQKAMKKKEFLENYKDICTPQNEYDNALTEIPVTTAVENAMAEVPQALTEQKNQQGEHTWKFTRALLLFYLEKDALVTLYNQTYNTQKTEISEEETEALSKAVPFSDVLCLLSEEKLTDFAHDYEIPLREEREKQEELIVYTILQR